MVFEFLHEIVHWKHATNQCRLAVLRKLIKSIVVVHKDCYKLLDDGF